MFKPKMKAVLSIRGCTPALAKNFKSQLPDREDATLSESNDDDKKKKKALVQNMLRMNIMILAMETEELMAKVSASATDEYPSGLLCKLWEALENEYEPSDMIASAELLGTLMKLKLNKSEDPKKLGEKISAIQARYKSKVSEEHKVAIVVNASGERYAETIRQEQRHLKGFGKDVTATCLIQAMHDKWRIGGGGKKDANDEAEEEGGKETAVVNAERGNFQGKCYNCGKYGHKGAQCPEKNQGQGKCEICGRVGHAKKDCWDNPDNAHKRPKWWKNRDNEEASGASVEIMLASMEVQELKWAGEEILLANVVNAAEHSGTEKSEFVESAAKHSGTDEFKLKIVEYRDNVMKTADSFSCDSGSEARKAHSLSGTAENSGTSEERSEANSFDIENIVSDVAEHSSKKDSVLSLDKVVSESASSGADAKGSSKFKKESTENVENVERGRVSESVVLSAQPSSSIGNFNVESSERFAGASVSTSEFGHNQ